MSDFPEWQPIETAPKNGTHVLVYRAPDCYVARWSEGYDCWAAPIFERDPHAQRAVSLIGPEAPPFGIPGPTHWAPLPAAP